MLRSNSQSDAKPLVFSSQTSLVLIYRPPEGKKTESTLPSSGFEPRTSGVEMSRSSNGTVYLRNASLSAQGTYRCEEKEYNINSKYAKLDNFLISASSSSCASASSSNARELDEQILEVKINPQEKNTVSDTSTNKDILYLQKRSRKMKTKKQNCLEMILRIM
ncbi:hypothetical protein TNCV_4272311 [Trichonephila clavipes]|nr:hypothetical protein TNCV_4272311 [Trichonephila clavipes]